MTEKGIRRYGPGKFDTILDSYVYALTLEGYGDDNLGDAQDFGFFEWLGLGLPGVDRISEIAEEKDDVLTDEEYDLVKNSAGAILSEDSQGFVHVDYFEHLDELKEAWEELEDEYDEFMEGEEEDSGEEEEEEEEEEEIEED